MAARAIASPGGAAGPLGPVTPAIMPNLLAGDVLRGLQARDLPQRPSGALGRRAAHRRVVAAAAPSHAVDIRTPAEMHDGVLVLGISVRQRIGSRRGWIGLAGRVRSQRRSGDRTHRSCPRWPATTPRACTLARMVHGGMVDRSKHAMARVKNVSKTTAKKATRSTVSCRMLGMPLDDGSSRSSSRSPSLVAPSLLPAQRGGVLPARREALPNTNGGAKLGLIVMPISSGDGDATRSRFHFIEERA